MAPFAESPISYLVRDIVSSRDKGLSPGPVVGHVVSSNGKHCSPWENLPEGFHYEEFKQSNGETFPASWVPSSLSCAQRPRSKANNLSVRNCRHGAYHCQLVLSSKSGYDWQSLIAIPTKGAHLFAEDSADDSTSLVTNYLPSN